MSDLWWLFCASAVILGGLIAYRAVFARLSQKATGTSDTRYVDAKSLARTRLLIDSAIAITALVTIVATALKVLG